MKNYIAQGYTLLFTAAADHVSGEPLLVGKAFGVVAGDVASGDLGILNVVGVYEIVKAGSQAWTFGAAVYWDDTGKEATTTASGNTLIGVAVEAVGSGAGETLGKVRLNGSFGHPNAA